MPKHPRDPRSRDASLEEQSAPELGRRQTLHALGALALAGPWVGLGCSSSASTASGTSSDGATPATPHERAGTAAVGGSPPALERATMGGSPAVPAASNQVGSAGQPAAGASAPTSQGDGGAKADGGASGSLAPIGNADAGVAGSVGQASDAGAAAPSDTSVDLDALDCIVSPEMTEGPFFVEEMLERTDLISGEEANVTAGTPLELTFGVFTVDGMTCTPVSGAAVDIWHADVDGVYSDVESNFLQMMATTGRKFLRAYQTTNESGVVRFTTVYPGWYPGRTIHIHIKIRAMLPSGSMLDFTSQVYFDETVNDVVMATPAYNKRGERPVRNDSDQVYKGTGPGGFVDTNPLPAGQAAVGETMIMSCAPLASGGGYAGGLKIGLQMA